MIDLIIALALLGMAFWMVWYYIFRTPDIHPPFTAPLTYKETPLTTPIKIRYFFLRSEGPLDPKTGKRLRGFPVACVASTLINQDDKRRVVQFAISTHNPLDVYNRDGSELVPGAKFIATERLLDPRPFRRHEVVIPSGPPINIKAEICKIIADPTTNWGTRRIKVAIPFNPQDPYNKKMFEEKEVKVIMAKRTRRAAKLWLKAYRERVALAEATAAQAEGGEDADIPEKVGASSEEGPGEAVEVANEIEATKTDYPTDEDQGDVA